MNTKTIPVTDTVDAKAKLKALEVLGLKGHLAAFGTWNCADGELAFLNSWEPVELVRGALYMTEDKRRFRLISPTEGSMGRGRKHLAIILDLTP